MMSEGSDMLILPFTSKTGQSVAQNRQDFFIWGLLVNRRHILAFIGLISDSRLNGYSRWK